MTLKITLPFGKDNVKNIIFTILSENNSLKLIQIKNKVIKEYGREVSFQAIRKAVIQLMIEDVILKKEDQYLINKEWVKRSKSYLDKLYLRLISQKPTVKGVESIRGEVSVFNFDCLNDLLVFWQDFIYDWVLNLKKETSRINCYQAAYPIEGIIHTYKEKEVLKKFKDKKIKSYFLTKRDSSLNLHNVEFHKKIGGINIYSKNKKPNFDENMYIGTYGDLILQTEFPKSLTKKLSLFFKKQKDLTKLDLIKLNDISKESIFLKLTIIKNKAMANHINESIINKVRK
jgi:hypothetical protein